MKQFYLQNLYKLLNHDIIISYRMVQTLFFFSFLQFASLNLDCEFWPAAKFLQSPLISFIFNLLSFTRIQTILRKFGLLGGFEEIMFLLIFSVVVLLSYLKITISLSFTNQMKALIKDRLELQWENLLHYKLNEFGVEILRIYNIFFPLISVPFFEILSFPIRNFLNSGQFSQIWLMILGILGVLMLFSHIFCHQFYFNLYEFTRRNCLTRSLSLTDILNPFVNMTPIAVHIFLGSGQNIIINILIQICFLLILMYTFLKKHTYFHVKVMALSGTLIIFKIMFLLLLLLSYFLDQTQEQPVFFIISLLFFYRIAQSLARMHIIAVIKNPKCNSIKWINEVSSRSIKNSINIDSITQKYLIFYGFLFYESPEGTEEWLQKIPLEIMGFISNHIRSCVTKDCPLNIQVICKYFEGASPDPEKKVPLFEKSETLRKVIKNYILFLYGHIPTFMLTNDLDFYMNYLLLLLTDEAETFCAIQQIHKLKDMYHHLSFLHRSYLENFLEIILKKLKSFEESQRVLSQSNSNKCLTNFNTKNYIDIENSYMKLTSKINKYLSNYMKFIENLMAEKPHLQNIANLGQYLLDLQQKIENLYLRASKTPRIILVYLEFRQVFCEDDRANISSLMKVYNYLVELQMIHNNEDSKNPQISDENLFFSDTSCFMHVSGSLETLGKILKVDENTKNAFGYQSASAMQGQNITFIMPKLVGKFHDGYMRRFLKTGKTDFLFKEQFLFARRCTNDIFRVFLTIKTFFDKSSQVLRFLTHLKPSLLRNDSSLILVDEFGYIDSYGGPIKDLIEPLFEEYKSNFYIQILIPQLVEYFDEEVEKHFAKKQGDTNWKRKFKTRIGTMFSNDILNLRIYDQYPSFPQAFEIKEQKDFDQAVKEKELEKARSYFSKLTSLMRKNHSGCKIYRSECLIESFKYEGLSFKLISMQKVRYLYYRSDEEIKRIDSKNVQALFILPKILIQTGLFRKIITRRSKNEDFNSCSMSSSNNQKIWEFNTVLEMEKLEQKNHCSLFEIKESLVKDKKKSKVLMDLLQKRGLRHALSCIEFGHSNPDIDLKQVGEKETEQESNKNSRKGALSKRSKTSCVKKIPTNELDKLNDLLKKKMVVRGAKEKKELEDPNANVEDKEDIMNKSGIMEQSQLLFPPKLPKNKNSMNKFQITNHQKRYNEDSIKNDEMTVSKSKETILPGKFFAENKRLIYRMESFDPVEVALEEQTGRRINHQNLDAVKKKNLSSHSSVQRDNYDRKSDLFSLINKPFIPKCYKYMKLIQFLAIIFTLLSFSLLAYFSTDILYQVKEALNRNSFIELFKSNILDCLMLSQKTVIFGQDEDLSDLLETVGRLDQEMVSLLNPPIEKMGSVSFVYWLGEDESMSLSLISSLFSFIDILQRIPRDEKTNQMILANGLNLFQKVEDISNMIEITSGIISDMQEKLFVLLFLSITIITLLVCLQILNAFSAFGYINGILRLFLSISINEYKLLMEKIVRYKEFKNNQETGNYPNKINRPLSFLQIHQDHDFVKKTPKKENNQNKGLKKSIRLVAVQIKTPIFFIMFVGLIYIGTFSSCMVAIIYQAQMLDGSLSTILKKISTISHTKSYNFQILIRLTDKTFFNNSYGFTDQGNQDLLNSLQNFFGYIFDENYNFASYDQIMNGNLCQGLDIPGFDVMEAEIQKCVSIGDGVLTKGLKPAFSYLQIELQSVQQNRLDISQYNNFDELAFLTRVLSYKIYEFDLANMDSVISSLSKKNNIVLSTSIAIAVFLSFSIMMIYVFLIQRLLQKKLIEVRLMLKLISLTVFSKSAKLRKYLITSSSKKLRF